MRSFSLIHMLPDRVSRWFGQQGEGLGEQGDAEKTTAVVGGIVDKGNNALQSGMIRGAGRGGGSKVPGADTAPDGGKGKKGG
jgi:hypothetical protein